MVYGLDLMALLRSGSYRWVSFLLHNLPSHTYLREAMLNDPETVEQLLRLEDQTKSTGQASKSKEPPKPALSEFTPVLSALADIQDQLKSLEATTLAVAHTKPKKPKPVPRPETLYDKAKVQHEKQRQADAVNELTNLFRPN